MYLSLCLILVFLVLQPYFKIADASTTIYSENFSTGTTLTTLAADGWSFSTSNAANLGIYLNIIYIGDTVGLDYAEFAVNTTGYTNVVISFDIDTNAAVDTKIDIPNNENKAL